MPMFDFKCEECGFEFEKMEPAGAKEAICPACEGASEKKFSGFGGFEFQQTKHLIDPGVKSVDHWLGKDTEKRSSVVQKRQHRKKQARFKHGDEATLTRFTPDANRPQEVVYDAVDEESAEHVKELHEFEQEFVKASPDDVREVDSFEGQSG